MLRLLLCLLIAQIPTQDQAPNPDGMILGRVTDAAGAGVSAATVSLSMVGQSMGPGSVVPRVLTDNEGRYFFDHVSGGRYVATVTKPGWIGGAYGQKRPEVAPLGFLGFDVAEHERKAGIDITMWKYSVISGYIVDEFGEPMVDLQVRAVKYSLVAGKRRMGFVGSTRTDDRGAYRLTGLVPGEYNVFVPATVQAGALTFPAGGAPEEWLRTMTGDGTAPMFFDFSSGVAARAGKSVVTTMAGVPVESATDAAWPAVPSSFAGSADGSTANITLGSGEDRRNIDMQLRTVPTYSVSGVLKGPADVSVANMALHLMSADLVDFPLFDIATATAEPNGNFTFYGVPQGDYVIRVTRTPVEQGGRLGTATGLGGSYRVMVLGSGPGQPPPAVPTEPLLHATEKVSVNNAPVRNVQLNLQPGARITGRAEFVGSATRPADKEWLPIGVWAEHTNGYTAMNPPRGHFAADGTFSTPSLMPGEYLLRANAPAGWTLKSIQWQGHDLSDVAFALGAADVTGVVVTYTDQPGTLGGNVWSATDAPEAGATVLVFPTDRDYWIDHGATPRRLRSALTPRDGTFKFVGLPAGEYHLVAISDEQAGDWKDPVKLVKLALLGKRIEVRDGEASNENLKVERIK